jgi:hypothetical protein
MLLSGEPVFTSNPHRAANDPPPLVLGRSRAHPAVSAGRPRGGTGANLAHPIEAPRRSLLWWILAPFGIVALIVLAPILAAIRLLHRLVAWSCERIVDWLLGQ